MLTFQTMEIMDRMCQPKLFPCAILRYDNQPILIFDN